jgi:hypothetical protein
MREFGPALFQACSYRLKKHLLVIERDTDVA